MGILEAAGIGILLVLLALVVIFVRREVISRRGGTIDMNLRLNTFVAGRGWSPGVGRFSGDELRWYRVFSFAFRPRRVLPRHGLTIQSRRAPEGAEKLAMPDGWVIVRLDTGGPVEVALAESALTGFLSWLEAAPPGTARVR